MADRNREGDGKTYQDQMATNLVVTYEDQMTTNLAVIIVSLLLLLGGFWLLTSLDRALKSERCLVHIEELYRVDLVARSCLPAFADDHADGFKDDVEQY